MWRADHEQQRPDIMTCTCFGWVFLLLCVCFRAAMHDIQHIYMHKVIGLALWTSLVMLDTSIYWFWACGCCGCVLYNKCYFRQHLTGEANTWRKKERKWKTNPMKMCTTMKMLSTRRPQSNKKTLNKSSYLDHVSDLYVVAAATSRSNNRARPSTETNEMICEQWAREKKDGKS